MSRARDLGGRAVDALQNRNLIVNGGMQIHQRGTSITGQSGYFYGPADRWLARLTSVGTWTASIETDVPSGTNLTKSLKYTCTTAASSFSGGERFAITQPMEYQNIYKIFKPNSHNKKQISVSFWVKSNVTGKYAVELYAQDTSVGSSSPSPGRRVSLPYTISLANTWERKTLTFPEDNSGRVYLPQASGEAFIIMFWGAGGPTYKIGPYTNTWNDVFQENRYPSDGVNVASEINNYWQFTGVQLEVSPSPTDFEYVPYAQELLECQRFYFRLDTSGGSDGYTRFGGLGYAEASSVAMFFLNFPTTMRTRPTLSLNPSSTYTLYNNRGFTNWSGTFGLYSGNRNYQQFGVGASGLTVGEAITFLANNNYTAYLEGTAEI